MSISIESSLEDGRSDIEVADVRELLASPDSGTRATLQNQAMHDHPLRAGRPGLIVVLNGPSSSGKTSLAKHFQLLAMPDAFLHVALDAFRQMEPRDYWSADSKEQWPRRIEALCRSINAAAAAYARVGENAIVDHVLPRDGWEWMAEDFAGIPVVHVGVHCSQEELDRRERARGDRPVGLAASQADVHTGRSYDFEVDTTKTDSLDCARALREWIADASRPSGRCL